MWFDDDACHGTPRKATLAMAGAPAGACLRASTVMNKIFNAEAENTYIFLKAFEHGSIDSIPTSEQPPAAATTT